MKQFLRKLILLLRQKYFVFTGYLQRILKRYPARQDLTRYEVDEGIYIDVFWKVLPIGKGPSLSLFCFGDEVLKFDCFGEDKGHYHAKLHFPYLARLNRIYFSEKTVEDQIQRTFSELTQNLPYYLQNHPKKRIQNLEIDMVALEKACLEARDRMFEYLLTVPEFEELRSQVLS